MEARKAEKQVGDLQALRCEGGLPHGLSSNKMALVTSDCDAIRTHEHPNGPNHLGMCACREKERVLAGRAVADVKALRQEVAKKNALGMQALQEMKKLQLQLAQRDAELQGAVASRFELG